MSLNIHQLWVLYLHYKTTLFIYILCTFFPTDIFYALFFYFLLLYYRCENLYFFGFILSQVIVITLSYHELFQLKSLNVILVLFEF